MEEMNGIIFEWNLNLMGIVELRLIFVMCVKLKFYCDII